MTDKAEQGDQVVSLDEILRDQKVTNIPTDLGPELAERIPKEPVEEPQGTTVVHRVLFPISRCDISENSVAMESILFKVADNPDFNPLAGWWAAWTGHGAGTVIKPPSGFFHVDFTRAYKDMNLNAGQLYFVRAEYAFRTGGGLRIKRSRIISFNT